MSESGVTPTLPEDLEAAPTPGRGASIGRFLVLGSLGSGGMGVVLSAYDPELDRKVALKLLRGDVWRGERAEAGRDALRREAQAMARLAHPNVVAVYEIAFVDATAYVVMEQVEGRTLRAWLDETSRPWADVVAMLLQAGEGLAAAHRAGVTHRDFKPQNVLVGDDGRPRVSDFGLASVEADAMAGTPAYMAPEQLDGARGDERSDQYAFCVTMWEALQGERPRPGPEPPRDKRAPAWLYGVLARGLAPRPEDRWPSMDALLVALRRQAPRRGLIVAGAVVVIGATAFVVGRQASMPPACSGGAELVASVWDDAARARVAAAFDKTGRPYSKDTLARVDAALRGRLGAWAGAHRDACEATRVRHEQSDTLLDLRMRCLAQAKAEIAALVSFLGEADAAALDRAPQATLRVGDLDACADTRSLGAAAPLPRDPVLLAQIERLRQEVASLTAMRYLGKWREGLAAGRAVVARARQGGSAPLLAAALYATGWFEINTGATDPSIATLYEAIRVASIAHEDEIVARATSTLVFALGFRKQQFEASEVAYRMAAAAIARAGNAPRLLEQLYRNRARTLLQKGDYALALPYDHLVAALDERLYGPASYEVATALAEVADAMDWLGRAADGRAAYARAIAVAETTLPPEHPDLAQMLNNFGVFRLGLYEYDAAATLLERALAIREHVFGADDPSVATTAANLAEARIAERRLAEARALVERALRIREAKLGPDHPLVASAYVILSAVERLEGAPERAHQRVQTALSIERKAYGEDSAKLASTYREDARALVALGRLPEARSAAEQAVAIDKKTIGEANSDHGESLQALAGVLRAEGRFADAIPLYRRAVALLESELGTGSEGLVGSLLGLCDALAETGDAPGALAACERASPLAAHAPADAIGVAEFQLAKAGWTAGRDRPQAVALAREARARLAALPYPSEDLPRIDRWLAARSR